MAIFRTGGASSLLGVSTSTLRRWADDGLIDAITDASGRLAVEAADELGPEPEMLAVAAVKPAKFSVEIPNSRPVRPFAATGEARRGG